jgi:hypothetical protein
MLKTITNRVAKKWKRVVLVTPYFPSFFHFHLHQETFPRDTMTKGSHFIVSPLLLEQLPTLKKLLRLSLIKNVVEDSIQQDQKVVSYFSNIHQQLHLLTPTSSYTYLPCELIVHTYEPSCISSTRFKSSHLAKFRTQHS